MSKLTKLCAQALEADAEVGRGSYFGDINLLALELRGQGGTFGYPLISTFGKMLYDATGEGCREDDNAVGIVKAHIDAMRAVLREKIAGDGGKIGRALLASLKKAMSPSGCRKVADQCSPRSSAANQSRRRDDSAGKPARSARWIRSHRSQSRAS